MESRLQPRQQSRKPRRTRAALPTLIRLEEGGGTPLHRQVYEQLRDGILGRRLAPGSQLPSTRALADNLGVSRNTVLTAFEQLRAEGYVESALGSGTYVAASLPDEMLSVRERGQLAPQPLGGARALSERGRVLASTPVAWAADAGPPRPFRPGLPALDAFPMRVWARLTAAQWRRPVARLIPYGDPRGYRPLREAIAAYLDAARGVRCDPDQIIVVGGSQQALDFVARTLLDPGEAAWLEEPGYVGARAAFAGAGVRVVPVPVDSGGLDPDAGLRLAPNPRVVYVSPSHHFPLGATMSLGRRLQLLALASRVGAWVVEDDYDSEFRYRGRPLPAMQGIDGDRRVVYVGTFSKVLFPSVRLGYIVAPPDLVDAFTAARVLAGLHAPANDQAVLAEFIAAGHFARHVRRMRALYEERQAALVGAAARELAGLVDVAPSEAGMHLIGWLAEGVDDRAAARRAAAAQIEAVPLSAFYLTEPPPRRGLLLGYTGFRPPTIDRAVTRLAAALSHG